MALADRLLIILQDSPVQLGELLVLFSLVKDFLFAADLFLLLGLEVGLGLQVFNFSELLIDVSKLLLEGPEAWLYLLVYDFRVVLEGLFLGWVLRHKQIQK